MAKKRTWKYWISRSILLLLLLGIIWVVNLIWFRPFNIRHFYDRLFIELAISNPELVLIAVAEAELHDVLKLVPQQQALKIDKNGETYYFCSNECCNQFASEKGDDE